MAHYQRSTKRLAREARVLIRLLTREVRNRTERRERAEFLESLLKKDRITYWPPCKDGAVWLAWLLLDEKNGLPILSYEEQVIMLKSLFFARACRDAYEARCGKKLIIMQALE